jgi:hypothetical protein
MLLGSSISSFEQELIAEQPEALTAFLKIEETETAILQSSKKPSTKERMKRLKAICTENVEPVQPKPIKRVEK